MSDSFAYFFSIIYTVTVLGNLIIFVVKLDPQLYSPKYFLLENLSFIDKSLISFATPKMIYDLISEYKAMSYKTAWPRCSSFTFYTEVRWCCL